ncbi:acyltransferase family protein [Tamlana sp. I1]|uniref:acyltransferase family protein n=1 Tax=Tamlana sp. I1 TaxID=2762061 RepID=UPI00188E3278|nr:acyltransferase family protein [Tamlana sp. I1]
MRNTKMDLIRFTGVMIIMIAHSSPPSWFYQLRNFGTPLLILGSALTYSYIYRHKSINLIPFLKKRLTRLTIPLWIFLTFFFLLFWTASLILKYDYPFSQSKIIESYFFYDGIGFVWIFKVYIILALITPYCLKLSKSSITNRKYFTLIIIFYVAYEVINQLFLNSDIPSNIKYILNQFVLVFIPYSILYLYGLRLHLFNNKTLQVIMLTSLLLFVILAIQKYNEFGAFVPTQKYKYPPTLYYLSYAFFCINLCYYIVTRFISLTNQGIKNLIVWLSSNSLWIYLWHIFASYLWRFSTKILVGDYTNSLVVFITLIVFLLSFGITMTYFQTILIKKFLLKNNNAFKSILKFLT